jgi:endonuclease/exonuclease/phosphatase family metal-dependent hydrolase
MTDPIRLLFWNVFLLKPRPIPGGPGLPAIGEIAAPAVADRAAAIGRTLRGRFDIAALSEAFEPPDRTRIVDSWGAGRVSTAAGPARSVRRGPLGFASSGLFPVVDGPALVRTESRQYVTRGSYLHDADALANKGVLMVEVDVLPGAGRLEVYSTHLIYGTGLLGGRTAHDPVRRHRLRMAQLDELVAFVQRVHRPGNVVAIVGDMNVPAHAPDYPDGPTAQHDDLMARLAPLGMRDLWVEQGIGVGDTCGHATDAFTDQTDPDLVDALVDRPGDRPGDPADADAHAGDGVSAEHAAERYRIDYLFLQEPRAEHTLALRAERPRRYAFPRAAAAPDRHRLPRLSDHLAVTVELHPSHPTAS